SEVTVSPASRTSFAAPATEPCAATWSRHRPTWVTPAATHPATSSASGQYFAVAWLKENRSSPAAARRVVIAPGPRSAGPPWPTAGPVRRVVRRGPRPTDRAGGARPPPRAAGTAPTGP